MRRVYVGLALVLLLSGGCMQLQEFLDPDAATPTTTVVPSSPFGTPGPAAATRVSYARPSNDTALSLRVDQIGRTIVKANPQAALEPLFATYSLPQPEIFHQGAKVVHITDALVKGCQTDGQLAAVLALELAKMVAEREAHAPRPRTADEQPPIDVPMGNAGQLGAVDHARLVELARYEKRRAKAREAAAPDPQVLAATFLENAGYARGDLAAVGPLLQAAEGNYILEKQLKTSGGGWTSPAH